MIFSNAYLTAYFGAFIGLLYVYSLKKGLFSNFNSVKFILLYYAFSALCSIMYYNACNGIYRFYFNIALPPLVYLLVGICISIYPLYLLEERKNSFAEKSFYVNSGRLNFVTKIIILCTILPFFESIVRAPQAFGSDDVAMMYAARMDGQINEYLSFFGRKFFLILWKLNNVIPLLLFFHIRKGSSKKIIIGLALAIVTIWLHSMVLGGRSKIVQNLMYLVFMYVVFKDMFSESVKEKIIRYGSIVLGVAILGIASTTISRFANMQGHTSMASIWEWLGLYAGEGILNFCEYEWFLEKNIAGHTSLGLFYSIIDGHMYTVADLWQMKGSLGIPGSIFYTYVGQLYSDYGRVGTIVFLMLVSSLAVCCVKSSKIKYAMKLAIVCFIGKILVVGPLFYTYGTVDDQINLIISVLLLSWILKRSQSRC